MRDRLTERMGDGVRYDNGKYIVTCYPKNNNLTPIDKLAVKLCDLEDKIECGAVIVPPCKVGDTVYRTSGNYFGEKIFEGVVAQISIYNNGEIRFWEHGHPLSFTPNDFGKTVFSTREEAEAKLKEGKG